MDVRKHISNNAQHGSQTLMCSWSLLEMHHIIIRPNFSGVMTAGQVVIFPGIFLIFFVALFNPSISPSQLLRLVSQWMRQELVIVTYMTVHVPNQHGKAAVLWLKDVLYAPGAAKNLLSTYCLDQQGYQFVADTATPKFPPGLHFPKTRAQQDRYVVLQMSQNCHTLPRVHQGLWQSFMCNVV